MKKSLGMMSPYHRRWEEFKERLLGSEGCNFRREDPRDVKTTRFDCDSTPKRKHARKILKKMGATAAEIEQSLGYFSAMGGFCDCEIVFNVMKHGGDRRPVRKRLVRKGVGRRQKTRVSP